MRAEAACGAGTPDFPAEAGGGNRLEYRKPAGGPLQCIYRRIIIDVRNIRKAGAFIAADFFYTKNL